MKPRVYEYERCSTCRKALAWLDKRGVAFERVPIVDTPPSRAELERMLKLQGGDVKRLFNTSGQLYRELGMGEKLKAGLSTDEALSLLAKHGKLIKRPFVLTGSGGAVGFREPEWKALFPR
jgi:Spx/MgsR family transcriptional regulator